MRSFCICGCGFDDIPAGANSLLDLLLTCGQRIVRNVESAPFARLTSITPSIAVIASVISLWRTGSPSSLISMRAVIVSLRLEWACSGFSFMSSETCSREPPLLLATLHIFVGSYGNYFAKRNHDPAINSYVPWSRRGPRSASRFCASPCDGLFPVSIYDCERRS